jgi:hypothetical protein
MPDSFHFAYYVVRVRVNVPDEAASVAGVVERLGTGRKRSFQEGQELLRLLVDWSDAPSKMPPAAESGNDSMENGGAL